MLVCRISLMLLVYCLIDWSSAEDSTATNWYCPEGWIPLNDGQDIVCLWLSNTSVNYFKAQNQCRILGGTLVNFRSENKMKTFKENFPKYENEYWIGLKKEKGYDAAFKLDLSGINPNADVSYMPTTVKEYINYKQACVYVQPEGEWEVEDCESDYYFLCEKDIECKAGTFGEKCSSSCHCLGEPCDPKSVVTRCLYGCQKGWMGKACDTEKQNPDVQYFCFNSEVKGKYVNIRINTKGVRYRSIYGLNVHKTRSPWCQGSTFYQPDFKNETVVITIPVMNSTLNDMISGQCAGEHDTGDLYTWNVIIKENEGILLEHDLQVTVRCNFSDGESLVRNSVYSVTGNPTELHKQSVKPQSLADDVTLQVVDSYSGKPITEAAVGSSVVLQLKYGLNAGSLVKGVTPYDCKAVTTSKSIYKDLIDHQGCAVEGSPVSAFSNKVNNIIQTPWFPLFAFEGEQNVAFQCSFDLCFTDVCPLGCQPGRRLKRSSNSSEHDHYRSSTIKVLPSVPLQSATNVKPLTMSEKSDTDVMTTFDGHMRNILMYANPITCSLFVLLLVVFLIMYVHFLLTLRRSVDNIRREIEYSRSRDKFLNCGCRKPLKDKDYVCP